LRVSPQAYCVMVVSPPPPPPPPPQPTHTHPVVSTTDTHVYAKAALLDFLILLILPLLYWFPSLPRAHIPVIC
jgi:hypothetical protein